MGFAGRIFIVSKIYIEQLYTFNQKHGLTVAYFALVPVNELKTNLFSLKKLLAQIIRYAQKRLQAKLEYTNVVFSLLPSCFTFNQLQMAYEVILGCKLDKRNFREKFLQLNLIRPTGETLTENRQRPAQLFRFISQKPVELKKWF